LIAVSYIVCIHVSPKNLGRPLEWGACADPRETRRFPYPCYYAEFGRCKSKRMGISTEICRKIMDISPFRSLRVIRTDTRISHPSTTSY